MGLCGAKCEVGSGKWEVGSGKWEKENYRALPRAKHSNRLFWPKFGFWALKENVADVFLSVQVTDGSDIHT